MKVKSLNKSFEDFVEALQEEGLFNCLKLSLHFTYLPFILFLFLFFVLWSIYDEEIYSLSLTLGNIIDFNDRFKVDFENAKAISTEETAKKVYSFMTFSAFLFYIMIPIFMLLSLYIAYNLKKPAYLHYFYSVSILVTIVFYISEIFHNKNHYWFGRFSYIVEAGPGSIGLVFYTFINMTYSFTTLVSFLFIFDVIKRFIRFIAKFKYYD